MASVETIQAYPSAAAPRLQRFSWALFDWAQQPYFTLVAAFLFKPYFSADYVGDPVRGQALVGLIGGINAVLIAAMSPFLGAAIDATGRPKAWVLAAAVPFLIGASGLWLADPGRLDLLPVVAVCMVMAAVSAELMVTANNAMLPHIASPAEKGRLSGSAVALGNLGGLIGLAIYMGLFNLANPFGLDKAAFEPQRMVGPFCAIWFAIFVLPMVFWAPEGRRTAAPMKNPVLSQIPMLLKRPALLRFLIGKMLIGDGLIAAAVFGAVLAAGLFGWGTTELAVYAVLIIVLGGLSAFLAGRFDDARGSKVTVMTCVTFLAVGIAGAGCVAPDKLFFLFPVAPPVEGDGLFASTSEKVFLMLALIIGAASGPLTASLRSWLAKLTPPEEAGRWFGLFAFSGRATSFAGPLLIAGLTAVFHDQRVTIPVVLGFLAAGLWVLRKAPERRPETELE